jgi:AraC family transcriptional regulator of adaptative response/methylated-DNA-[protein]-cysteine methyltransferase
MKTAARSTRKTKTSRYATDQQKWQAVLQKDPRADGQFFFAVKTTGIYCRPSCPSRPAKRENVSFYHSTQEAEKAGFRACQRCKPQGPDLDQQQTAAVVAACRTIAQAEELPPLSQLAAQARLSPSHFHRIFKAVSGLTPQSYAMAHRSGRVRKALSHRKTVTEAIYASGFNSNGRFYATSTQMLGMKPREYRQGGLGATIRFAIGKCSLGSILVASSAKGVCAILIGDDPDALARDLQDRFPKAHLIGGDLQFEKRVAQVVGFIEAPKIGLNLPLDVRGTAFQRRVWKALQDIPIGSTATYSQIARRIGLPQAVRAVAGACGANALAVAIPCHRVVRKDGSLSGYRWGVQRKRALLQREKEG